MKTKKNQQTEKSKEEELRKREKKWEAMRIAASQAMEK
jgi:hypothetical protein